MLSKVYRVSGNSKRNKEYMSSVFQFISLCFYFNMSHDIYHMSSRATLPEYQPHGDTKALARYVTLCLWNRVTLTWRHVYWITARHNDRWTRSSAMVQKNIRYVLNFIEIVSVLKTTPYNWYFLQYTIYYCIYLSCETWTNLACNVK